MGEIIQQPTLVKIEGTNNEFKLLLFCKMLALGYDVMTDASFPSPKTVYQQQIKDRGFVHSRFAIVGHAVTIYINSMQEEIVITRADEGTCNVFVDFVIWCWGMTRGGRCPYTSPIIYGEGTRNEWQII